MVSIRRKRIGGKLEDDENGRWWKMKDSGKRKPRPGRSRAGILMSFLFWINMILV
jgi:hypothetical protein